MPATTFEDAVKESIKRYYQDHQFTNYEDAVGKPVKYTKKYFDSKEKELIPEVEPDSGDSGDQ